MILDGWGIGTNPEVSAIKKAKTPFVDSCYSKYANSTLEASGLAVGLPEGQMGNSEVGHLSLGSGRVLYQSLTRISKSIQEASFFQNEALLKIIKNVQTREASLHLMGLVSSGGVHSYNEHLYALLELAAAHKLSRVYVHCFLDGRDTPLNSGLNFITKLQEPY